MKKRLLCAALVFALALTACGGNGGGNKNTSEEEIKAEDINVNIDPQISADLEIMVPGGNMNERTMINCLIDDFALMYPNVNIELCFVSVDNYVSQIRNLTLGNTLPDIIWNNSPDFYDVVELGAIVDLNPFIEANEKEAKCNAYLDEDGNPCKFNLEDDFYQEFFDMGSRGDTVYVIPRSCDSVVTFYNVEMLTAAGVDFDPLTTIVKNGWSWDDFLSVCAQVRTWMDNNGHASDYVIDANLTSWLSVCYPMLASFGAEAVNEKGENAIKSERTKECLEMVREMVVNRYINDSTVSTGSSFETGGSAMLFQSASISHYAERPKLKGKIDLVSFPLIKDYNQPKIGAGVAGYSITKTSKNKEVAWAFLTYLLSRKGQQKMALNGLNLASIRRDLSDYKTANWGKGYENINLAAYTYGSEYKIGSNYFERTKLTAKAGIQAALTQLFMNATNKSKNIDEIIDLAERDIDDAMLDY